MEKIDKVKEYAKKKYPRTFKKTVVESRNPRTGVAKYKTIEIDPIVREYDSHWTVSNNIDASPIILSKGVI